MFKESLSFPKDIANSTTKIMYALNKHEFASIAITEEIALHYESTNCA